jgi:hypothetical protein
VLQDFLVANRTLLFDRCRLMVAERSTAKAVVNELTHGIPIFLEQLIKTLTIHRPAPSLGSRAASAKNNGALESDFGEVAALHGRDLLAQGFTLEQVVRDYGDVCQAVTDLAFHETSYRRTPSCP